jgi:hypothetical protein
MNPKRKRDAESNASNLISVSVNAEGNHATDPSDTQSSLLTLLSSEKMEIFEAEVGLATSVIICRAALVKSPAASRAALAQHRASIDPELANMLKIIGGFKKEVIVSYLFV